MERGHSSLKEACLFLSAALFFPVAFGGWRALACKSSMALSSSQNRLRLVWHVANNYEVSAVAIIT